MQTDFTSHRRNVKNPMHSHIHHKKITLSVFLFLFSNHKVNYNHLLSYMCFCSDKLKTKTKNL